MIASVPPVRAAYGAPVAGIDPRAFDGVRSRRAAAYVADLCFVLLLVLAVSLLSLVLALPTLGLSLFFWLPSSVAVAVLYSSVTIAGAGEGTWGMRLFGLRVSDEAGRRLPFLNALVHAGVFYATVTFLTPLVLLVCLFNREKRLLQDYAVRALVTRRH